MVTITGKIDARGGGKVPARILELLAHISSKVYGEPIPTLKQMADLGERFISRYISEEHFEKLQAAPLPNVDPGFMGGNTLIDDYKKSECKVCKTETEQLSEGVCGECWDKYTITGAITPTVRCKECKQKLDSEKDLLEELCFDCYAALHSEQPTINTEGGDDTDEVDISETMKKYGGWTPWFNSAGIVTMLN